MADKDYSELGSAVTLDDTDLFAKYPTGGPLKKVTWATLRTLIINALGSTYLLAANNLSDIASAALARANLGLGTAATLASGAFFQTANNLSEVPSASAARTNLGAAASSAPIITGGVTLTGSTKQNVQAVAGTSFDVSLSDFFTKSISADTTFTFTGAITSTAECFIVLLTVGSGATPTWPAAVKWAGGSAPVFGNGLHVVGFMTFDGGTTWEGFVGGKAFA